MKNRLLCVLLVFLSGTVLADHSPQAAFRVDSFLKKIALRQQGDPILRRAEFTQAELNAYLNLIYTKKYAREVETVDLKFGDNNQVRGSMKVKLQGSKYNSLPSFLRNFTVEFSGLLESTNRRMRYVFEDIRINGTRFSPEVLDEAFATAQTGFKVKKSMFDWFNLLPGLKKITCTAGKVTLYY